MKINDKLIELIIGSGTGASVKVNDKDWRRKQECKWWNEWMERSRKWNEMGMQVNEIGMGMETENIDLLCDQPAVCSPAAASLTLPLFLHSIFGKVLCKMCECLLFSRRCFPIYFFRLLFCSFSEWRWTRPRQHRPRSRLHRQSCRHKPVAAKAFDSVPCVCPPNESGSCA